MRTYRVEGEIFFAPTDALIAAFDEPLEKVISNVGEVPRLWVRWTRSSSNIAAMTLPSSPSVPTRQEPIWLDRFAVHDKCEGVALTAH